MSTFSFNNMVVLAVYGAIFSLILWFVFAKFFKIIVIKTWLHWILLFGFSCAVIYAVLVSVIPDNY